MKYTLIVLHLLFGAVGFSQLNSNLNMDSLAHFNYVQLHDTYLNDVWGHVDNTGKEYALVGARKGISIVDVSNPINPIEIYWEAGEESIWRDINTWQNLAYVTTEAESGLLIIDMNSLPNAGGITSKYYYGPLGNEWKSAHTLYIDSAGYAYIFGANRGNGGVIILDIHTDPMNPIEVGVFDDWYCHDGFVQNDTMYLAHIAEGFFSIVDITDKANPVLLGTKTTHSTFTHNIWVTPNGKFAYTTDEVSGAFIGAYDISDPTNIIEVDLIQNSPGKGVIPHNVHWMNDYLITSYYSDGVVVFDASRPHNLVKVADFDTYPTQTTGFDGCWASYPFLPSGIILAADITGGLFIANPTYIRASYLEGEVRNQSDNSLLSNVKVSIQNNDHIEFSKNDGKYATGIVGIQTVNLTFFKVGFYPKYFQLDLNQGEVTVLNVMLEPIPQYNLKVIVKEKGTETKILDADVRVISSLTENEGKTNGLGELNFSLFYEENYEIQVGKWGFITKCYDQEINTSTNTLTIELEPGIYDDFTFDNSWTIFFDQTTQGFWERGKPNPTITNSAPGIDSDSDCGEYAFVTGNNPNISPDVDFLKNGAVFLYSPIFDLSDGKNPFIHYERWFYTFHGAIPYDDTLEIRISNGLETVSLDKLGFADSTFFKWNKKSFYLPDYISLTQTMQVQVVVSNFAPQINITEAGFDNFFMDSYDHFAYIIDSTSLELKIYPNPMKDMVKVLNIGIGKTISIYDLHGKLVFSDVITNQIHEINVENLRNGIYFLRSEDLNYKLIKN
jgi:choice-of-anchor B domain-containing protein